MERISKRAPEACRGSQPPQLHPSHRGAERIRNRESCLRLVTALAVEQSEEWITGRRYLDMQELKEHRPKAQEVEGAMLMER
jgi:hypothetical protein